MSVRRVMVAAGVVFAAIATMSACSQVVGFCTDELRVQLTPRDTTVAAGRAFTPAVTLSTCSGRERLEDTFTFTTSDADVAAVEPTTGRVTAVGVGQADILVTGQRHGAVGRIRVAVSP